MLQRINREFDKISPNGEITFFWNGEKHNYKFKALPTRSLNNNRLNISNKKLLEPFPFDDVMKDVAIIILFGAFIDDEEVAQLLSKCEIGDYIGKPERLETFVKQRYIHVSRITTGFQSNTLGHVAQNYVKSYLAQNLAEYDINIFSNGTLPGVTHTVDDDRLTSFDLVVEKNNYKVAIEISFQVTTNSVIERKAGQAQARYEQIDEQGFKLAHIIDGAGNFQRRNAVSTICSFSHCTVAFSDKELSVLCEFIQEYFEGLF